MDSDLTTTAEAASALSLDAADSRLPRIISSASALILRSLNRTQLHYAPAYVEKLRGYVEQARLVLDLTPVASVASVVMPDGSTLSASDYELEAGTYLYRASGWPYTGRVRSGLLYDMPYVGTERASIVVTYAGGWVTPAQATSNGWAGPARSLPFDLEDACLQLCAGLFQGRGRDGAVQSESLGDYSVSYRADAQLITPAVESILALYRRPA